jgi:excisionase family DNA binding protein
MMAQGDSRDPKRLLSLKDAASELGMSVWTLRDLVGSGSIRAVQPPGIRRILIDRKDLERAIEAWKA